MKSYKLKVVLGGSELAGKTSFILGKNVSEPDFNQIGVSFKPIECLVNNGDSYKFVVWDLKASSRFQFLYPIFCRGASAGLLVFDVSNYSSFQEVPEWIKVFRNNEKISKKTFPIILIGTKTDKENKVSFEDAIDLAEEYDLNGVFFTSVHESKRTKTKEAIFKHLIENLEPSYRVKNLSIFVPKEDELFQKFLKFFSICPVCQKKNHFESLKSFYYSRDPILVELKNRLIDFIEESNTLPKKLHSRFKLGIPCCSCFKKFFEIRLQHS
ncbi:MAG: hypothetical protein GF383_07070 [Candidatus Lokiarchaeota archaeon]|nr:hypothetical protein [Candidatus Lokiarchaeota archaeon]MBD3339922.1 hypothetical protein [Candidatus Lokiarchaeota archaeon]